MVLAPYRVMPEPEFARHHPTSESLFEGPRSKRMTLAEERAALETLGGRRVQLWHALVSWPTASARVLERLESEAKPEKLPRAELDRLSAASNAAEHAASADVFAQAMISDNGLVSSTVAWTVSWAESVERSQERDRYLRRVQRAQRAYEDARNRLVRRHLGLVAMVAHRFADNRMSLGDRMQEGALGLLTAIERFDVRRETRVSTYAVWWIRHHIRRALVNRGRTIRIPASLHRIYMKARAERPKLVSELGRDPTVHELAEAVAVDERRLAAARRAMELRDVGLDAPVSPTSSRCVAEVLPDPASDIDQRYDRQRSLVAASGALSSLDARSRQILERRFGLDGAKPTTLRELGERYSLSRERIRQLQNKALEALRSAVMEPASAAA